MGCRVMLEFHPVEYDTMIPSRLTGPLCALVVPKGLGFVFPVSSDRKSDAFAASSTCAFPITQFDSATKSGCLHCVRTRLTFLPYIILFWGEAKDALYCAHRATTVSSWGLCEQKGHLASPPPPFYSCRSTASGRWPRIR